MQYVVWYFTCLIFRQRRVFVFFFVAPNISSQTYVETQKLTYDIARRIATKHEMSPSLRFRYFSLVTLPLVKFRTRKWGLRFRIYQKFDGFELVLTRRIIPADQSVLTIEVSKARQTFISHVPPSWELRAVFLCWLLNSYEYCQMGRRRSCDFLLYLCLMKLYLWMVDFPNWILSSHPTVTRCIKPRSICNCPEKTPENDWLHFRTKFPFNAWSIVNTRIKFL